MNRIGKWFKRLVRTKWWAPSVCGVLGILFILRSEHRSGEEASRNELIARRNLTVGQPFRFDDFTLHRRSVRLSDPEVVTDQHLHLVENSSFTASLAAGEVLKFSSLQIPKREFRHSITKGERAYTFRPENGRLVRPGDRVDILLRPRDAARPAAVIVADVLVLEKLRSREGVEITVALPQRDLHLMEKAQQQGKLNIALLGDKEPVGSSRSGRKKRAPKSPRQSIEVIAE